MKYLYVKIFIVNSITYVNTYLIPIISINAKKEIRFKI